jgi:hypothetical protein
MKKEAPLKCKGLNKRHLMKKEAPLKHKGLSKKTSDEKRGTLKMQWAKQKTSDKKRGTHKTHGVKSPRKCLIKSTQLFVSRSSYHNHLMDLELLLKSLHEHVNYLHPSLSILRGPCKNVMPAPLVNPASELWRYPRDQLQLTGRSLAKAPLAPPLGGESAFEEKGDKSYELNATSIKSPRAVSKITIFGACAGQIYG